MSGSGQSDSELLMVHIRLSNELAYSARSFETGAYSHFSHSRIAEIVRLQSRLATTSSILKERVRFVEKCKPRLPSPCIAWSFVCWRQLANFNSKACEITSIIVYETDCGFYLRFYLGVGRVKIRSNFRSAKVERKSGICFVTARPILSYDFILR